MKRFLAAALVLAGCGSTPVAELPPPARPARSPALVAAPAGEVMRVGNRPEGIAYDAETGLLSVALHDPDELAIVDPDARRVVGRRPLPAATAQRPDLVVDGQARTLAIGGRGTIPAGVGPTHAVPDGHGHVWVVDTDGGAVLQVNLRPEVQIARRTRVPGAPYGVAYDPGKRDIWVTQTALNRITRLSAIRGGKTTGRYPAVRQPNAIAVDHQRGRVFVAGKADGVIQILDPAAPSPRR